MSAAKRINWKVSITDAILIEQIADRVLEYYSDQDRLEMVMNITACHANGCTLNLADLLSAPEFDFKHDIRGIHFNLDRETGQLLNCFVPRCAAREAGAA